MMTGGEMNYKGPNIAVVGYGYWGKNLVRNYHSLGALRLVCDKNHSLLTKCKETYSNIEASLAFSDVLAKKEIDGVVIATPAETHFVLAREALLSGKHVYVEKPLVLNENEAEQLIAIANERSLILMVGHLLQYHPVFVYLMGLVTKGELGRINYIYSHRLNLGKIRREENILWSFAPHDISMILALAGEEPESVLATGGNYLHKKIADVTTTHFEFPSGLKAHIFVSWLHPFKDQKLVVVGDEKMAVFDDTLPWNEKLLLYPHKIKWENNIPVPDKAEAESFEIPEAEPLRLECEHFLDCIENGKQPKTDGKEGFRVLRVLNASQLSLNNQGSKIFISSEKNQMIDRREPSIVTEIDGRSFRQAGTFIHPSAVIDSDVSLGEGTKIWHFSHIIKGSKIGSDCNIGQNVVIGPDVNIGNKVKIQNNVSVFNGVTIEDGVFCGPSMVFTNVYNPRSYIPRKDQFRKTLVKEGVTLGANCTIMCGLTLGRFSFVGAGAVVLDDVPDFALVVGNPAKIKGWMCSCGIQLHFYKDKATCNACGSKYRKKEDKIVESQ
jgi:predicted dehydrogenase/acetyltransferase-like isoleucine patch superfamily enzyme